jgi:hypothetical protein
MFEDLRKERTYAPLPTCISECSPPKLSRALGGIDRMSCFYMVPSKGNRRWLCLVVVSLPWVLGELPRSGITDRGSQTSWDVQYNQEEGLGSKIND